MVYTPHRHNKCSVKLLLNNQAFQFSLSAPKNWKWARPKKNKNFTTQNAEIQKYKRPCHINSLWTARHWIINGKCHSKHPFQNNRVSIYIILTPSRESGRPYFAHRSPAGMTTTLSKCQEAVRPCQHNRTQAWSYITRIELSSHNTDTSIQLRFVQKLATPLLSSMAES